MLAVNLRGVFVGCQLAGAHMREQRGGRIVNLGSLAAAGQRRRRRPLSASKAGIVALSKTVARELAPDGVTVNAVAAAAIEGPLVDALPPETVTRLTASIPLGRLGRADEVAALIAYLASDAAGFRHGVDVRRQRRLVHRAETVLGSSGNEISAGVAAASARSIAAAAASGT